MNAVIQYKSLILIDLTVSSSLYENNSLLLDYLDYAVIHNILINILSFQNNIIKVSVHKEIKLVFIEQYLHVSPEIKHGHHLLFYGDTRDPSTAYSRHEDHYCMVETRRPLLHGRDTKTITAW